MRRWAVQRPARKQTANELLDGMKQGNPTLDLLEYFKADETNLNKVKTLL